MSPFHEVEDRDAGPTALGILIPPGRRTFVILRPRSLKLDLVLTRDSTGLAFREIFRDEAPRAVQAVRRALEAWAQGGQGQLMAHAIPSGQCIRCTLGDYHFIACRRLPGQPYQPHIFTEPDRARQVIDDLLAILRPAAGTVQEIYSNTRHFEK